MSNYASRFNGYLRSLAARKPAPGGGSAVCLIFCLGLSLMEKALVYSQDKNSFLSGYCRDMVLLRSKIQPFIDLDSELFGRIMREKNPEKRAEFIRESERLIVTLGLSCKGVFLLAKQAKAGIKKGILSDFSIGLECVRVAMTGCLANLEANCAMFGRQSKYIRIFRDDLKKWPK